MTKGRMALAYASLVGTIWSSKSPRYTTPDEVKRIVGKVASRFMGYDQQDAQELLRFLLDAIHEDLNRIKKRPPYQELKETPADSDKVRRRCWLSLPIVCFQLSPFLLRHLLSLQSVSESWWSYHRSRNDSIVEDLFTGQLRSEVICNACGTPSRAFDPFLDLAVPISRKSQVRQKFFGSRRGTSSPATITECLEVRSQCLCPVAASPASHSRNASPYVQEFVKEEELEKDSYYCSKCKTHRSAKRSFSIFRCPRILVLHLKRFTFSTFRRSKLSTSIDFPTIGLSLKPFIHPKCKCIPQCCSASA